MKSNLVKEIPISDAQGFNIGHFDDSEARTGVTVLYFPKGATVGCDVSGGGPASRETPLAMPSTADNPVNAIVLSGGSAYGLAASDGVMRCLEDHGIGYDTGIALVPLVCQSCIYDLGYGKADVRPDAAMGYVACANALSGTDSHMGNVGAGIGATVGKLAGMGRAMSSGLGIHSVSIGELQMTAIVVVNALGDIFNPDNGQKIAGLLNAERSGFSDTCEEMLRFLAPRDMFTGNTTIGAIITNGKFTKAEMTKIARMAGQAYSRCINPVATMADGDTVYGASVGEIPMDLNLAGMLAANVMKVAILNAIHHSQVCEEEFLKNIITE